MPFLPDDAQKRDKKNEQVDNYFPLSSFFLGLRQMYVTFIKKKSRPPPPP
jgi:hypothetical protein